MKRITLEEFAEIAKNDEALKEKMIQIAVMQEGSQTDEMIALAAEYGYELEKSPILDMEELSDDDLENVAGGAPYIANLLCKWLAPILDDTLQCDKAPKEPHW